MIRRDARIALLVAGGALPVLCYGLGWGIDRDVAIAAGDRILRGEWPYRDFWTVYAPGSGAAVAATFAWVGRELIAVHAVAAVVGALACGAFYRLLAAVGAGRRAALAASAVFVLAIWTPSPPLDSYALARLFLLLGLERVARVLRGGDPGPALSAGLAFGAAAWFKHDVAAYAAAGSALAILLAAQPHWRPVLRRFVAGCSVAVVPGCAAVALMGGAAAWQDLIVFPATDFAAVRGEPYPRGWPPLQALVGALTAPLPLRAAAGAAFDLAAWAQAVLPEWLVALWALQALVRRQVSSVEWLAVACLPFFWAAAHVQQNTHLASMGVLCAVLLVQWWQHERVRAVRAVLVAFAVLLAGAFVLDPGLQFARMQVEQRNALPLGLPGTRGVHVPAQQAMAYRSIISRLWLEVPRGEPIHVALARHDAVIIGDPNFYFLADRPAATRYHELHPGIVDRADTQREIIEALERRGVRVVVRWRFGWPDRRLDEILERRRRQRPDLGAVLLDDYLQTHFKVIERYGEYELLRRRGPP